MIIYLIILSLFIILILKRKKIEKMTDDVNIVKRIDIRKEGLKDASSEQLNTYLGSEGLRVLVRNQDYNTYIDERSKFFFNKKKPNEKTVGDVKVLFPNVKSEGGNLVLDEPSEISLEFHNKPINTFILGDDKNYCNRNIIDCNRLLNDDKLRIPLEDNEQSNINEFKRLNSDKICNFD